MAHWVGHSVARVLVGTAVIYYVCLDNPNPSGGVKTMYRHVEILNVANRPAAMLHQEPGFSAATWFDSSAPICYASQAEIGPGDVLVWPEILQSSIQPIEGVTNIIFNQNIHYTWRGMMGRYQPYGTGVSRTMVLTEYERGVIESYVPRHPVHVVRHGIDPRIFGYDGRRKKKQIVYFPRKHRDEAENVFGWLSHCGALKGWSIVEVDQSTEKQTAEALKDAALFFAFGYPEGGTLPPFEALAAGCNVVGYGGFASDSLLREAWGRVVPSGDSCVFASVARDLCLYPQDLLVSPQRLSDHALAMFPMNGEKTQLLAAMEGL